MPKILFLLSLLLTACVDDPIDTTVSTRAASGAGASLLLILHGAGFSGSDEANYENAYSLGSDVVVLAPELVEYWNGSIASCYQNCERDDVATLSALVDSRVAVGDIDPTRVRVIGHSSGAIMVWRLLCERPDLFRAGVVFEGFANANGDPTCAPSQPINVLHVHGTADAVIPYGTEATLPDMTIVHPAVTMYGGVGLSVQDSIRQGVIESTSQWPGSLEQEGSAAGCTGPLYYAGAVTDAVMGENVNSYTRTCAGRADHWRIENGNHVPPLASTWIVAVEQWFDAIQ
jgi:poly(3-hydroxybutyrate) depolymerase